MIYSEGMEARLRNENARLTEELTNTQLDLEDAKRSRRDLQQQLSLAQQRMGQVNYDYDNIRVGRTVQADGYLTHICRIEIHTLWY